MKNAFALLALIPLALGACGGGDDKPSRAEVLKSISQNVIVPKYEAAARTSAYLETTIASACTNPSRLFEANKALKQARMDWKSAEAVFLGPVMDKRTDAYVDYKVDTADVDRLATSSSPVTLDAETVGKRIAADQRGYGALEHLLAGPHIATPRGCEYAKSIANVAADQQQAALTAWTIPQGDEPPYRETIVKDPNMALDDLVNDNINLLRAISDLELRPAVGRNGAAGDPTAIQEGALNDGVEAIEASLSGVRSVLLDSDSEIGISELLTPETAASLGTAMNEAIAASRKIKGSLRTASQTDKQLVIDLAERIDDIRRILSTEVVSQLGIALGFSDSDGDSAA